MTYHAIEERVSLYKQIQGLNPQDRIEVTTYQRNFRKLDETFLRLTTTTRLAYFVKADGEEITLSSNYNPSTLNNLRERRIKIRRIIKVVPLQEKVNSP